jgi:hypothetical protein
MPAKHLPLLWAFGGGCVTSAALIGVWFAGAQSVSAPVAQRPLVPSLHAAAPPVGSEVFAERALGEGTASDRSQLPTAGTEGAGELAAPAPVANEVDAPAELAPEPGSSVSDVLAKLESAYRQGLAAPAPDVAPAVAPPPASTTVTPAAPPSTTVSGAPAALVAAASPTDAARTQAPALLASAAEPVPAAVASPPPREVNAGSVNQNIHVGDVHQGNVHQGNVHQGDTYDVQQVAVLQYQYTPLFAVPQPGLLAPPAQPPTRSSRRVMSGRTPSSPTALMNPDNPWGFNFPPTVLVK